MSFSSIWDVLNFILVLINARGLVICILSNFSEDITKVKRISVKKLKAIDIEVGMQFDLEGDKYADPNKDCNSFKIMNVLATNVEVISQESIRIIFDSVFDVVFPINHELKLVEK